MAEGFGYTRGGGDRGGGSGRGVPRPTLEDGRSRYFSLPGHIESEPTLLDKFKNHLKCLGGYSEDEDKGFCYDNSVLNFLNTNNLPDEISKEKTVLMDLTKSEEKTEPYTGTTFQTMNNFFSWILSNDEKFFTATQSDSVTDGAFVFAKSVVSGMLRIPYTSRLAFGFFAVYVDGIVYLMIDRQVSEGDRVVNDHITNWAHKFEQYMVHGEDTKEGVVSNRDYRCVLASKLGSHKLLYSSSVDCFNPDLYDQDMTDLSASVYLKCIYESMDSQLKNKLTRFKMLGWCTELTMTGVPQVIVGFRNNAGIVEKLKLYTPEDLILRGKEFWNINVCFTFLDKLLSHVKERTKSKPGTAFFFEKPASLNYIVSKESPIDDFPPQWFIDEIKTANTSTAEEAELP